MGDVVIVMAAALAGGLAAYLLRLPMLLGYIVAGVVVGPHALALVHDLELIHTMASVGIVLLMFTLGMEFSLADLRRVGAIGLGGGAAQILVCALAGYGAGRLLFGWSGLDSVFFGFLIALSSTAVVLKILLERGEADSSYGRVMIAVLLVQDVAVFPLMIILPALGEQPVSMAFTLGVSLAKATLVMGAVFVIGARLIPHLLGQTAGVRSRELFLIAMLALGLGTAFGTSLFGISEAFGAFVAGMLVSRSHFAHQALAEVLPIRSAFAALFFVSLGMLVSPLFIVDNWPGVLLATSAVTAVKFIIMAAIALFFGYSLKTVLLVGAGLAQIGEFSFVLAQAGLERGVISEYLYSLILSTAAVTILLTPLVLGAARIACARLGARQESRLFRRTAVVEAGVPPNSLSDHVIICGHGRTGANLSSILKRYHIPYMVADLNPRVISDLRDQGIPSIYGDAGSPHILDKAGVGKARVLALACPDPMAELTATEYARRVNPNIDIIARAPEERMAKRLRDMGVTDTVEPNLQASLEFVRHTLHSYAVDDHEIEGVACPFLRQAAGATPASPSRHEIAGGQNPQ